MSQTNSRGSVNIGEVHCKKESLLKQIVIPKGGLACSKAQQRSVSHYYEGYPDAPRVIKSRAAFFWASGTVAVVLLPLIVLVFAGIYLLVG